MGRGEIFPEDVHDAKALSLDIKLTFGGKRAAMGMGWFAQGMPVLLYKTESKKYVAKCLPFNQLGSGNSILAALESLARALVIIVEDAVQNNYLHELTEDINNGVGRPADFYWEKYAEIAKRQTALPVLKKAMGIPTQLKTEGAIVTPQAPIDIRTLNNMRRQFAEAV